MSELVYKHYIKTNENSAIVKLFSDAFEQPDEDCILLRESDQRHVYLGDYVFNPAVGSSTGFFYKYVNGEVIEEESDEILTDEQKLVPIREKRNTLLSESDKFMLIDKYELLTPEERYSIKEYRQALRDLPETVDLDNPQYPIKPF
jgi:hypothetical protein